MTFPVLLSIWPSFLFKLLCLLPELAIMAICLVPAVLTGSLIGAVFPLFRHPSSRVHSYLDRNSDVRFHSFHLLFLHLKCCSLSTLQILLTLRSVQVPSHANEFWYLLEFVIKVQLSSHPVSHGFESLTALCSFMHVHLLSPSSL